MSSIVQKYEMFEIQAEYSDSRIVIEDAALFCHGTRKESVSAYQCGEKRFGIRFMPDEEGTWEYKVHVGEEEIRGSFECVPAQWDNHGPVRTKGYHFCYADDSIYVPFGTTCYAWTNQTAKLQEQTIETLKTASFNKIRMCVFPKSMPYNNNDPDYYPFRKDQQGEWNVQELDFRFWDNLDHRIRQLKELGIEADLILFHPYDRWGFSELSQEDSLRYLEYCIARFSAYRHIWWSLANEYECLYSKSIGDWDEYGEMLVEKDKYHHLISVHNIISPYPKREWLTHCSIQSRDIDHIGAWKEEYGIPVVIDECGYEGNLPYNWGSLSAFEMVHRFWWTLFRGGFCTHGETFHREDEVLWWAKGGKLYGESPERIAFLKDFIYSLPGDWEAESPGTKNPNLDENDQKAMEQEAKFQKILERSKKEYRDFFAISTTPMAIKGKSFYVEYLGRNCAAFKDLLLKEDRKYRVEIIDIWEMTRTTAAENVSGVTRIELPGKEGIAVLAMEV